MPKKNQKKKAVLLGNPLEAKSKLSEISSNTVTEKAFETVLERLEREFPHVAQEIIEEIYEENARSYISTKKKLEEIFPNCENENKNSVLNSNQTNLAEKDQANLTNTNGNSNNIINNTNNHFKEAENNFTDETDKVSSKTEKSKNEKSDFSNELSRQISGSNSNISGNAYAETNFNNNEENANVNNKFLNNPVLINLNYSKKGNKKTKNRAYDISELVNGSELQSNQTAPSNKQNDLLNQNFYENNNDNNDGYVGKLKPIKDLIAFKFEDNFLSSDEEKPDFKQGGKNKHFKKNNFNNHNNKKVSNFKSNNNNQKTESKTNFFQKENKHQANLEAFQYHSSSNKNLDPEQLISNYFSVQKKNSNQYQSVFDENLLKESLTSSSNNTTNGNNFNSFTPGNPDAPGELDIYYFEELLLEYYIKVISEFFPNLSSTEIMEKICEFDFDIDGLVISLLDTNHEVKPGELNKLVNNEVSEDSCIDLFKNFYFEENADYEVLKEHNLQAQIEQEIKKNLNKQNAGGQVKINNKSLNLIDLNSNKAGNSNVNGFNGKDKYEDEEEYFLDKPIHCISTKSIRDDLIKLATALPLVEEAEIKWVYYQYMDYSATFNYFLTLSGETPLVNTKNKLSKILKAEENNSKLNQYKATQTKNFNINNNGNSKYSNYRNPDSLTSSNGSKKFLSTSSNSGSNDNSFTNNLYKIINENPQNWRFENNGKFSLSEYQELRRKLIYQAQLAWRSGRHQDAKVIMAKAKRYKEDINMLLRSKKLEVFLRNNEHHGILNMINKRENFIDVHGLSYDEAKILVSKKVSDIKKKKNDGTLDESRPFCLSIITGVGNHSVGNRPVLLPKLNHYFKNFECRTDWQNGTIKVFI